MICLVVQADAIAKCAVWRQILSQQHEACTDVAPSLVQGLCTVFLVGCRYPQRALLMTVWLVTMVGPKSLWVFPYKLQLYFKAIAS